MKGLKFLNLALIIPIMAVALMSGACKKAETKGQITVKFLGSGENVSGAKVKLYVDGAGGSEGFFLCSGGFVTEKYYVTGANGQVNECFELPSLITVHATWTGNGETYTGETKLNLIEHETTKTVVRLTK